MPYKKKLRTRILAEVLGYGVNQASVNPIKLEQQSLHSTLRPRISGGTAIKQRKLS